MGRVARYKKVKAFDPYSQQNRGKALDLDTVGIWGLNGGGDGRKARKVSQTVRKLRAKRGKNFTSRAPVLDAAYEHGDDFDLHDLVGSLKKEALPTVALSDAKTPPVAAGPGAASASSTSVQPPNATSGGVPTVTSSNPSIANSEFTETRSSELEDDEKVLRRLKLDAPPVPPPANPIVKAPGRMPGESQRAFQCRVKSETRQIMRKTRQEQHNPEKRQRKKEFLNRKKQAKKPKTSLQTQMRPSHPESDNDDNEPKDATPRAMRLVFGEQVEAPPVFRQTPRGAIPKAAARSIASGKTTGMKPDQVQAEHDAMEQLRQRVQAQYAQVKAQRKRNGDFHL